MQNTLQNFANANGSQCELAQQQTIKYIYTKCMHNVNNYFKTSKLCKVCKQ